MIKRMTSGVLGGIPIKLDTETGIVTVKDQKRFGVKGWMEYSRQECEAILASVGEITPRIHLVKSVFDGTVVSGVREGEQR